MMAVERDRNMHSRWSNAKAGALVLTLAACAQAIGGEHGGSDPCQQPFIQRLQPVGGWHPDGGGLFHWWNPQCFPRYCAPDDYCRKPPPSVCRPAYPCYYIWAPAQAPRGTCP
jgi:hypothetical protein